MTTKKSNYVIHKNSKHTYLGFCSFCFEKSKFRHCLVDGVNQIACVICMKSKPLLPNIDKPSYMVIEELSFISKVQRFFIRIKNIRRTIKIFKLRRKK